MTTETPVTLDGFPAVVERTAWPRFLAITAWNDPLPAPDWRGSKRRALLMAPEEVERVIARGGTFFTDRNSLANEDPEAFERECARRGAEILATTERG